MTSLNEMRAKVHMDAIKRLATDLSLDDPERLLRNVNLIGGQVASLRAIAKHQLAETDQAS